MQFRSIRTASLLAALVVTSGLWAYQTQFTGAPTDPLYTEQPAGTPCQRLPGQTAPSPTCIDPPGQWDMFSFNPTATPTNNNHPSGISADAAWLVTAGRPDVEAVVFDSGINYDHVDLRNQIWLNCKELPAPRTAAGLTVAGSSPGCREPGAAYDIASGANGAPDGIFSIRDYQNDVRVTSSTILPAVLSRSDLRTFEDGVDNDGNGFKDDISGFDFDDVDGDEYDHRDFGHGTGRNGVIAAEANNGAGIAGMCTNCRISNARIEDTYVVIRAETTANAAIWAADLGFEVINMSLGHVGASSMSRKAFEYAYSRNVLPVSAIANEFHFHHGFVGLYDEVLAVGALSYAGSTTAGIAPNNGQPTQAPTTYLRKANYSNYGAHLNVVAPSDNPTTSHNGGFGDSGGTSSATPHVVGTAALVFSIFRNCRDGLAPVGSACNYVVTDQFLKDISAQEVRQVINQTADDIKATDDPASGTYPVSVGWDKWTGYGRVNAKKAVDLVAAGKIPPEADINSPDWYTYVDGTVPVKFYANNRWRGNYSWVLEVAPGVEPASFTLIEAGSGAADKSQASTSLINNFTSNWNTTGLAPGGYTLRLRVSDAVDPAIKGEDRMFVWLRRGLVIPATVPATPGNHPGFPIRVTRTFNGEVIPVSTESMSNALVDLDGDNQLEIIVATSDGEVRVYKQDGTPFSSFGANGVVMTDPLPGLPGAASQAFDGNFANGEVPVTGAFIIGGVAVGDIDRDGGQEICAGAVNGKLYCWKTNGTLQPGFPVSVDIPKRYDQYTQALTSQDLLQGEALVPPPTLSNIDGDAAGTLEIAAVSRDQKLYVWKADGARLTGFPVTLGTPNAKAPAGSISGILAADIDNDGKVELLVGSNETLDSSPDPNNNIPDNLGRIYAFTNTGGVKTGWPVQPSSASANGVPIVAQGVVNGPLAANFDTDAQLEIVSSAFLGDITIYNHDGALARTLSGTHAENGGGSDLNEETQEGGPGRQADAPVHSYVGLGAIAALNPQAGLEYVAGTVGNNLVANVAAGSGAVTNFFHYLSAWDTTTGRHLGGWPRIMEGWQFINGPVVADLDGNNTPEVIEASSGLFMHAFNGTTGGVIPGWPKFTGHWAVNTPSVGDLDNNGKVEVVNSTRLGYIQVWDSLGAACNGAFPNAQWRKYRHDEWNTGAFGADTLRPAAVSNLSGSRSGATVNLNWTAVGDDGPCGTAAKYEMVISDSPVTTTAAFDDQNLTRINITSTPSGQTMTVNQTELAARYYTLRVADEAGNRSPLSASVQVAAAPAVTGTGVVAVTQPSSPTGGPGTAVNLGSFTLTHSTTASESHEVSQITLALSDPSIFESITLTGPDGRTAFVSTPVNSTVFNFSPALEIAPGTSGSFTVTAQLSAGSSAALDSSWLNSAYAGDGPVTSSTASTAYALLLLLCAMLLLPRRLAVGTLLALGMLAGCGSDRRPGPPAPDVLQTKTSTVIISTVGAATTTGGTVSFSGLPATLGTVTLQF